MSKKKEGPGRVASQPRLGDWQRTQLSTTFLLLNMQAKGTTINNLGKNPEEIEEINFLFPIILTQLLFLEPFPSILWPIVWVTS